MQPYNFLGLVNTVNNRLNEVELTESNFNSAIGWYAQAKEAVNAAIQHISNQEHQWPFYYVQEDLPLVVGQVRYNFPANAQSIKTDSFRLINGDNISQRSVYLSEADYEQVLKANTDMDMDSSVITQGRPTCMFRYPDLTFGVHPAPNDTYTLRFEWYSLPPTLEEAIDVPVIPEQWRHVITNGAMMYAYLFRGDGESAAMMREIFDNNIKLMRKVYENRYVTVRSSMRGK